MSFVKISFDSGKTVHDILPEADEGEMRYRRYAHQNWWS